MGHVDTYIKVNGQDQVLLYIGSWRFHTKSYGSASVYTVM